ncbi:MAG: hypothetical protein EHM58_04505 [Ignavibacteriae bacterium]|nr:MAG: hypothetical protein EHM58_04505 [Ignavibacteriota bacterium]
MESIEYFETQCNMVLNPINSTIEFIKQNAELETGNTGDLALKFWEKVKEDFEKLKAEHLEKIKAIKEPKETGNFDPNLKTN